MRIQAGKRSSEHYPQSIPFDVPPKDLWEGYGADAHTYLTSGRKHLSDAARILRATHFEISKARTVLDFGCAAGRMLRHLPTIAPDAECWGADVNCVAIQWCEQHLSPPFRFSLTTPEPRLPFADSYFDLIICGSVFTHIDQFADAWFEELARILRVEGRLFFTVHDRHTIRLLDQHPSLWLARHISSKPGYHNRHAFVDKLVIGSGLRSQVFYDLDYLQQTIPSQLAWLGYEYEAYFIQTGIVLAKQ